MSSRSGAAKGMAFMVAVSREDGLVKTAAWFRAGGECVSFADGQGCNVIYSQRLEE